MLNLLGLLKVQISFSPRGVYIDLSSVQVKECLVWKELQQLCILRVLDLNESHNTLLDIKEIEIPGMWPSHDFLN